MKRGKAALTPWLRKVRAAVQSIAPGQTAGYARVALMAGKPGAARAVVRALHALDDVPWWRVVRSDGTLAEAVAVEQARRLRQEGVPVVGRVVRHGPVAAARQSRATTKGAGQAKTSGQRRSRPASWKKPK